MIDQKMGASHYQKVMSPISGSTVIREINRYVVGMVANPVHQGKPDTSMCSHHFVRKCVTDVRFKGVSGNVNVADMLTKSLDASVFIKHRDKLLHTFLGDQSHSWVMSTSQT